MTDPIPHENVALIAVHGIADQLPEHTAAELAQLLQSAAPDSYTRFETTPVLVPVGVPREPVVPASAAGNGWFHTRFTATQLQIRNDMKAAGSVGLAAAGPRASPKPYDIKYSESYIERLQLEHDEQTCSTIRMRSERKLGGRTKTVDVYEFYWADISRLGNSLLRIAGEFYQLLFHLLYLGRMVIAHARNTRPLRQHDADDVWWKLLHLLQAGSEILLTRPIALLNTYLLVVAVALAMLLLPQAVQAPLGSIFLLLSAMGLAVWLQWRHGFIATMLFIVLAVAALFVYVEELGVFVQHPAWLYGWVLLVASAVYVRVVHVIGRRIEGITLFGYLVPPLLLGATLWWQPLAWTNFPDALVLFSVRVFEVTTMALIVAYALLAVCNALLYLAGGATRWFTNLPPTEQARVDGEKATVMTARAGVFFATTLFVIFTVAAWGLIEWVARDHLPDLVYPALFTNGTVYSVSGYLTHLMYTSAASFSILAGVLALICGVSIFALAVPLLREVFAQPAPGIARKVGQWLDDGSGLINRLLRLIFVVLAFGTLLFQWYLVTRLLAGVPSGSGQAAEFALLIKLLAGSGLTLIALSSRLGKVMRSLRAVLDLILDVDNYFKDRPASSTPRGRMYARCYSLLRHLANYRFENGTRYDRIVIVAHSQGTVIMADLLRVLARNGELAYLFDQRPLHLVTAGSPLRQLYAARFPDLYAWVRGRLDTEQGKTDFTGPDPRSLGVSSWTNLYQSGDYVGRTLWQADADKRYTVPADHNDASNIFAYQDASREVRELCVGSGAHTHYFDGNAPLVAGEIERRIG